MTSPYELPTRVVTLLDTYDGAPIWRLSEGKNGVVKLELTWQPPTQQKQHKWPRQPSPARTPPPKPAPPVQPPPKTPAKSPTTIEMVSPPGTPDVTPPPGSRWTPKTPTKSPPSQMQEDGEDDPFCGFTEDDDRSSSLQKYRVNKILHKETPDDTLFIYQLQHLQKPERNPSYAVVSASEPFVSFYKPPESKYHVPDLWSALDKNFQISNRKQHTREQERSTWRHWYLYL